MPKHWVYTLSRHTQALGILKLQATKPQGILKPGLLMLRMHSSLGRIQVQGELKLRWADSSLGGCTQSQGVY